MLLREKSSRTYAVRDDMARRDEKDFFVFGLGDKGQNTQGIEALL